MASIKINPSLSLGTWSEILSGDVYHQNIGPSIIRRISLLDTEYDTVFDANEAEPQSFYNIMAQQKVANFPKESGGGYLFTLGVASHWLIQIWTSYTTQQAYYIRKKWSSSWSNWYSIKVESI